MSVALVFDHLWRHTAVGFTAGDGKLAFGGDTINFWTGARLAIEGRLDILYDFEQYHAFQVAVLGGPVHLYFYSYPPVTLLPTLPLGTLPYLGAWTAWTFIGWALFFLAVRRAWPTQRFRTLDSALFALAAPAVMVNTLAGQTGTWLAALVGAALMLLPRRPILAGAMLGLLVVKPQLAVLVPVALVAGQRWGAFLACGGMAAALLVVSGLLYGIEPWLAYMQRTEMLRTWNLEDGTGVSHWFISVFTTVRHLPSSVSTAYAAQAAATLAAAALVWRAWRMPAPEPGRHAVLVLATLLATPYVQIYDLVIAGFVPIWLLTALPPDDRRRLLVLASAVPLLLIPAAAPIFALQTGLLPGPLLVLPALAVAYLCLNSEGADRKPMPKGSDHRSVPGRCVPD